MDHVRRALIAAALALPAFSLPSPSRGARATEGLICTLTRPSFGMPHKGEPLAPAPEARLAVNWITGVVGLSANFAVGQAAFVKKVGAYAVIADKQRRIVYDADFFSWVEGSPNWRETGIMAHEVGHHLGGHTRTDNATQHAQELEADRFAGFVLAKLGASLPQATRWAQDLSEEGAESHPPRRQRLIAISDGWRHGKSSN